MLWFSLYNNSEYKSDIAAYPDVSQIKGIAELEKNHTLILQELNEYIQANGIQSHFNITMVEKIRWYCGY